MNYPAQPVYFASGPTSRTSEATYFDGGAPFGLPPSNGGVSVHSQNLHSSTWHYPPSESPVPSSVSDAELYDAFLTDEFARTDAKPHNPSMHTNLAYASIVPNMHGISTYDSSHGSAIQFPSSGSGYVASVQYGAYVPPPSVSIPAHTHHAFKQRWSTATAPCIAPSLIESPPYVEHALAPAHDEYSTRATTRHSDPHRSRASPRHAPPPPPLPSPSPEPHPHPSSELISSPRRNAHVPVPPSPSLSPSDDATVSTNRWKCPYCRHVQHNRRSPDLKRHIETHTRGASEAVWVCCGVPIESATEAGVPSSVVRTARTFEFGRYLMIGGCRKTFSRKDALTRHLRNYTGTCYGDAEAGWQPGNRL